MNDVPKFIVDNSFLFCCEDRKGGHIYRKNFFIAVIYFDKQKSPFLYVHAVFSSVQCISSFIFFQTSYQGYFHDSVETWKTFPILWMQTKIKTIIQRKQTLKTIIFSLEVYLLFHWYNVYVRNLIFTFSVYMSFFRLPRHDECLFLANPAV